MQRVDSLANHNGRYLSDGDELLSVDHFSNKNDFSAALHEGGTAGVAQNNDEQDNDDEYDGGNTDEYLDNPPVVSLGTIEARG